MAYSLTFATKYLESSSDTLESLRRGFSCFWYKYYPKGKIVTKRFTRTVNVFKVSDSAEVGRAYIVTPIAHVIEDIEFDKIDIYTLEYDSYNLLYSSIRLFFNIPTEIVSGVELLTIVNNTSKLHL